MSSIELGMIRFRLLQDSYETNKTQNTFMMRLVTSIHDKKLKEERDNKYSDKETLDMVEKWLKYIKENDIDVETYTETDIVVITIIDKDNKEFGYTLKLLINPKLDSLTIYSLLRHKYRVYRGRVLGVHQNIDKDDINPVKSYKEYIKEHRKTYNNETLEYAEAAFRKSYPVEKSEVKVKLWLNNAKKIDTVYPISSKSHTIAVMSKGEDLEEIYELNIDHALYGKMILHLHKVGYVFIVIMNVDDVLIDDV